MSKMSDQFSRMNLNEMARELNGPYREMIISVMARKARNDKNGEKAQYIELVKRLDDLIFTLNQTQLFFP